MAFEAITSLARIFEQMLEHQHVVLPDRKLATDVLNDVNSIKKILEASSPKSSKKINSFRSQFTVLANSEIEFIRCHIENQVPTYPAIPEEEISVTFSPQFLKKVRARINLLKSRALKIKEMSRLQALQTRSSFFTAGLSRGGDHPNGKISVAALYDDFLEVRERLLIGSQQLQIISVVGMGGIGKTTLVTRVYKDLIASRHFDIQAWVTVSQSYDLQRILIDILDSMKILTKEMSQEIDVQVIKEYLYKNLKGRRYLIVMDDVWDSTFWYDLKQIFPNDSNSSRVLLTTRLENVAVSANSSLPLHRMSLLDEDKSWNLFCQKVFGGDHDYPPELKEIGKKMVQTCGGLPLAIVVLAGFLSKVARKQDYWISIAENLSSKIISNDEKVLKMLSLSYMNLPPHIKQCFLYTGIFPEDFRIPISRLVNLWVAEGFVKPIDFKSLEDVAYGYLLDLIDRSFIMVDKWSSQGRIKMCKIHDLVRDFCAREAKNAMSLHIADKSLQGIPAGGVVGLLSIHPNETNVFPFDVKKLSSLRMSSVIAFDRAFNISRQLQHPEPLIVVDTEGIFRVTHKRGKQNELQFDNLRYLACRYDNFQHVFPPTSSSMFRNLQTLILHNTAGQAIQIAIWNMPNLRHVLGGTIKIPDPINEENSFVVLENLQTLSKARDFRCSEEVIRRIPNLKKLGIIYDSDQEECCSYNLTGLCKLEKFKYEGHPYFIHRLPNITFPPSLRSLKLYICALAPEDMHKIGSLPNLQVLKLVEVSISRSTTWEPVEGEFLNLKYLDLNFVHMMSWKADGIHFPILECLMISGSELEKIPSGIGDIPTLKLIELYRCSTSFVSSVKEMQEEQLELGNDVLQVRIHDFTG